MKILHANSRCQLDRIMHTKCDPHPGSHWKYGMSLQKLNDIRTLRMRALCMDDRSEVERSLDGRNLPVSASEVAAYATTDTARPSGQVSVSRPPRPIGSQ